MTPQEAKEHIKKLLYQCKRAVIRDVIKDEDVEALRTLLNEYDRMRHTCDSIPKDLFIIGHELTLYKVYVDSKGPHLTSAQYVCERDPEHLAGIRHKLTMSPEFYRLGFAAQRLFLRRWSNYLYPSAMTWRCCAFTPEEAWTIYIRKQAGAANQAERECKHDQNLLRLALLRQYRQPKRKEGVA